MGAVPKGYEKQVKMLKLSVKDYFEIMNIDDPSSYEMKDVVGFGADSSYDTERMEKPYGEALDSIQEKAREFGADVIVNMEYSLSIGGRRSNSTGGFLVSGIAIKKDKGEK